MDLLNEVIASNEFGDWLVNESEVAAARVQSRTTSLREVALQRLAALDHARHLLYEFLTLQQQMIEFAREDRTAPAKATSVCPHARAA